MCVAAKTFTSRNHITDLSSLKILVLVLGCVQMLNEASPGAEVIDYKPLNMGTEK